MKSNCNKCGSSDANHYYDDENPRWHCFSCNSTVWDMKSGGVVGNDTNTSSTTTSLLEIPDYRSYPIASRGISQEVVDYFNVKMSVDPDGKPASHFYPYTKEGQTSAYKERKLPKEFRVHGDFKGVELFGQSRLSLIHI